jgi:hypothetical protein
MREFVVWFLNSGQPLFREAAGAGGSMGGSSGPAHAADAVQVRPAAQLEDQLHDILARRLPSADAPVRGAVEAVFPSARAIVQRRVVLPGQVELLGADEVYDRVCRAACKSVGREYSAGGPAVGRAGGGAA